MKKLFVLLMSLALPWAAQCATQDELVKVIQSDASLKDKAAACAELKWIGTPDCVPVLAGLLTDTNLSHVARYALESMPFPEADAALRDALPKTTGSNEVGIIDSLGVRADAAAVPALSKLLGDSDKDVAVASAIALGHIGGPDALAALQDALVNSPAGPAHDALCDGILDCANKLLTSGEIARALPVFEKLYNHEKEEGVRLAAFRGMILSSDKQGLSLMIAAIKGPSGTSQAAALQLASKLGGPATTEALGAMLEKVPVAVQIALLQALQQRGDRRAAAYIMPMLENGDHDVRMAALSAIGDLGDGRAAGRLAKVAATASGEEKTAAREALVNLRHGNVTDEILKRLTVVAPEYQAELIRALGDRGDASAATALLDIARSPTNSNGGVAFQALAMVAGTREVPGLIQLVIQSTNDDVRSEAADALASAYQHIESRKGLVEPKPLADAVHFAPTEARVALLGVCSGVSAPEIRDVLRAGMQDTNEAIRKASIRAMCESQDPELLADILKIATGAPEQNFRTLGLRGCVRLITGEQNALIPVPDKISTLKALLDVTPPLNAEGKRLVLSGLAVVSDLQALDMASAMLDDADVKVEAGDATVEIAREVGGQHPAEASAALKRIVDNPANPALRKSAQAALRKIKQT